MLAYCKFCFSKLICDGFIESYYSFQFVQWMAMFAAAFVGLITHLFYKYSTIPKRSEITYVSVTDWQGTLIKIILNPVCITFKHFPNIGYIKEFVNKAAAFGKLDLSLAYFFLLK